MLTELQTPATSAFGRPRRVTSGKNRSLDALVDLFGPLLSPDDVCDQRVAEIGAESGDFSRALLAAGVSRLIAVEPSDAFPALVENLADEEFRVDCLNCNSEFLPADGDLDFVFAVGALHRMPRPRTALQAAFDALRPGGRIAIWLYGQEGWSFIFPLVKLARAGARQLPSVLRIAMAWTLTLPVSAYVAFCRFLPLPLHEVSRHTMGPLSFAQRHRVIRDQLNAPYTKHYNEAEARQLLEGAGFCDIQANHRLGYSWSLVGVKPPA